MTWRGRRSRAWLTAALAACGCVGGPGSTIAPSPPEPPVPVAAVKPARADAPADVARSQKPDTPRRGPVTASLLGQPVERPAEASHASPTATICAVVNGEPILEEEVRTACFREYMGARTAAERQEVFKQTLETIIDREVLLQDAFAKLERGGPQGAKFIETLKKMAGEEFEKRWMKPIMKQNHIESREELAAFMRNSGLSLDMMRRWSERQFMSGQYLHSRIEPHLSRIGHVEIAEYYAAHHEEFVQPDTVQWQDIFIDATQHATRADARKFAESLAARVKAGEDFARLSEEFDNGTSGRFRKGEGQGHKHGEIHPPEAEPALFRMRDGDIDIVERPRGFHVVRLVKRQYAGPIPFDAKIQKEIRDKLRNIVFQREMKGILAELKRKAVIERADLKN